ncbi:phage/plasmid primase, P4 family [Zhihengliuella sp. ISTPL4]|uniref:phage/plasmid primase, P4 family n=1 Tax=Zhihengliuella sp. ISTPL4 TaxID=2058657 RepID=UPI000C7C77CF|nr:phage/plasmid primase, P4 family [Zhihengliuella sp. ISTPL4]
MTVAFDDAQPDADDSPLTSDDSITTIDYDRSYSSDDAPRTAVGSIPQTWGRAQRIRHVTEEYLDELSGYALGELPPALDANSALLARTTEACVVSVTKDDKARPIYVAGGRPTSLTAWQIAMLTARWNRIRRIAHAGLADKSRDELRVYQVSGADKGLFVADESQLRLLVRAFDQDINDTKMREVIGHIYDSALRVEKNSDPDAIPCKSRVFDFRTKTQREYDPERDVFTSKLAVDCPLSEPQEPTRTIAGSGEWTFSSWLLGLFEGLPDAEEVAHTVWEIISAAARPGVRWGKAAFFHSVRGNSGKGTLLEMIENLFGVGSPACCSIPLDQWGGPGNEFKLEPLLNAIVVLVDENNVGEHLPFLAALKAAVTGDRLSINRKNQKVIMIRFRGLIIQCVNALPNTKDKSGSFSRRQLFVPFQKSFTGAEVPEIKNEFLRDPEVLEFVLWRALHMSHYTLSEPTSCRALLEDAKTRNDLVHEFWQEVRKLFVWDLLPFAFLYQLFEAWRERENAGSRPLNKQTFIDRLLEAVHDDDLWICEDRTKVINAARKMDGNEPLLREYDVPSDAWNMTASTYKGIRLRDQKLPNDPTELAALRDADINDWHRSAFDDDGVEDKSHVADHASHRRAGQPCPCQQQQWYKPEPRLTAAVRRSQRIDAALAHAVPPLVA